MLPPDAVDKRILSILRRSQESAAFGGVCSIGWGLAMRVGGARTINSLLVRSMWPFFVVGGALSILWAFRPGWVHLAQAAAFITFTGWFGRAVGALAWAVANGHLWDSRTALVVFSHLFVADLVAATAALRMVPLAKTLGKSPPGVTVIAEVRS